MQILLQKLLPPGVVRVRSLVIVRIDLAERVSPPQADPGLRWAIRDDLEELAVFGRRPVGFLSARLESGGCAAIAEHDGRIVGVSWYLPGACEMDDWLRFVAPPRAMMGTGARVAPEARGQGLFPRIERFAAAEFAQAGHTHMFGWIEALNRSMRRAHRAAGGVPAGRILVVRWLGFGIALVNGSLRLGRWSSRRPLEISLDGFVRAQRRGPAG